MASSTQNGNNADQVTGIGPVLDNPNTPNINEESVYGDELNAIAIKKEMGFEPWEYSNDEMYGGMMTMGLKDLGFDGAVSDKPADGIVIFDPSNIEEVE